MNKVHYNRWKTTVDQRSLFLMLLCVMVFQYTSGRMLFDRHPLLQLTLGLAVLSFLMSVVNRDFFLFFLSDTVYPCDNLEIRKPSNALLHVRVRNVTPNAKIVYWASELKPNTPEDFVVSNPFDAYGD